VSELPAPDVAFSIFCCRFCLKIIGCFIVHLRIFVSSDNGALQVCASPAKPSQSAHTVSEFHLIQCVVKTIMNACEIMLSVFWTYWAYWQKAHSPSFLMFYWKYWYLLNFHWHLRLAIIMKWLAAL
jgi:hypothetical protein